VVERSRERRASQRVLEAGGIVADQPLRDQLMDALREEFPGIEARVDRSRSGRYLILRYEGKTVGYVNGRGKLRVQSPNADRDVLIVHPLQIGVGVDFVGHYVREAAT